MTKASSLPKSKPRSYAHYRVAEPGMPRFIGHDRMELDNRAPLHASELLSTVPR